MDAALASWGGELDDDVSSLATAASNISDADARIRRLQQRIRTPQRHAPAPAPAPVPPPVPPPAISARAASVAPAAPSSTGSPRQLPHGLVPPSFAAASPAAAGAVPSPRLTPPELRRIVSGAANGYSPVSPALTPPPVWTPVSAAPLDRRFSTADDARGAPDRAASLALGGGIGTTGADLRSDLATTVRMPTRTPPPAWTPVAGAAAGVHDSPSYSSAYGAAPYTAPGSAARMTPLRWDDEGGSAGAGTEPVPSGSLGGVLARHAASASAYGAAPYTAPRSAARMTPLRWDDEGSSAGADRDPVPSGSLGGALAQHTANRRRPDATTERRAQPMRQSASVRASPLRGQSLNSSTASSSSNRPLAAPKRRGDFFHHAEAGAAPASHLDQREDLRELNPRNVKLVLETVGRLSERSANLDRHIDSLRERVGLFASLHEQALDENGGGGGACISGSGGGSRVAVGAS